MAIFRAEPLFLQDSAMLLVFFPDLYIIIFLYNVQWFVKLFVRLKTRK